MEKKEKVKAYGEDIERTEKSYGKRIAEEIFPELKESEDEKIRRWIIDDIKYNINNEFNNSKYTKEAKKAIAWLEKQGKQKQLYIHFGEIPTDEKSKIYKGEIEVGIENGVSVYPAFKTNEGNIVLGLNLPITETTLHTQQHLIEYDNRPCYLVKGDYIGKDTDGQPLINNVSIIEKIDNYRVKEKIENIDNQNCIKPNNMDKSKSQENDWLEKQRNKDKLIQELGEYKVKYTQEVLEKYINSMSNKDDERLRKTAIAFLKDFAEQGYENAIECIDWLEKQGEQNLPSVNERAWLYLVSDVLTWKDGIGQYLDDPRVQELAKKLCSEYAQKLYNPSVLSNSPNTEKNEQKSANKIEPRFKVGDWVVQNYNLLKIRYVGNEYYCFETVDAYVDYMLVSEIDSLYHLWTIQDAKVGDVLEFEDHGRLVIGILSGINKTTGKVDVSCLLEDNKFKLGVFYNLDTISPHPAIKEQRDILMKAMNDAGYKWNTRTKTLEKLTEPKFDPKTLQPFDKVLVRNFPVSIWQCGIFSHKHFDQYFVYNDTYKFCIPYNNDTKHLIGTTDEAPEYYKYWED